MRATLVLLLLCSAAAAHAQTLTLRLPAGARAGTVVEVVAEATEISPKLPIEWVFPADTLPAEGDEVPELSFGANCRVLDNGRRLVFAWPRAGEYKLVAEAFVAIKDGDDVIGFRRLKAEGMLRLAGAVAGPDEPLVIPPLTDPQVIAAVAPIRPLLAGQAELASELSRVWWALGTIAQRGGIKSTAALQRANIEVGRLMTAGKFAGRVPGLAPALENVFADAVGLDNAALDAAQQARVSSLVFGLARVAAEAK